MVLLKVIFQDRVAMMHADDTLHIGMDVLVVELAAALDIQFLRVLEVRVSVVIARLLGRLVAYGELLHIVAGLLKQALHVLQQLSLRNVGLVRKMDSGTLQSEHLPVDRIARGWKLVQLIREVALGCVRF